MLARSAQYPFRATDFQSDLDSVNKSALVGFPLEDIYARLSSAWTGSPTQLNVYQDVQTAASAFRQFCLENNLLDYSLQVELFRRFVWRNLFVSAS